MSIREDAVAIMRSEFGEGFELETFPQLSKEYAKRNLRKQLIAVYMSRIDNSGLLAAREALEAALASETEQFKANEEAVEAQVDNDLEGL